MDRSFLSEHGTPGANSLANAVVGLGAALALEVVAEGIEVPEQAESLRALGCDSARASSSRAHWAPRTRSGTWPSGSARPPMHHSYEGLDRAGGASRQGLLAPLRQRDFRLCGRGCASSLLGDGAFIVALAWQVYQLSDAPSAMGLSGVAMTVPTIVVPARRRADERPRRPSAALDVRRDAPSARPPAAPAPSSSLRARWRSGIRAARSPSTGTGRRSSRPSFDAIVPDLLPSTSSHSRTRSTSCPADRAAMGGRRSAACCVGASAPAACSRLTPRASAAPPRRCCSCAAARAAARRGRLAGRATCARAGVRAPAPWLWVDVRERGDRLPAVHGPGRGARAVRGQARPRRHGARPRLVFGAGGLGVDRDRDGARAARAAPRAHDVHLRRRGPWPRWRSRATASARPSGT
jgi:hypothetical protein